MSPALPPAWRRLLREAWASCNAFLFAPACLACGLEPVDRPLCAGCTHRLERREPPWCLRCGEPCLPEQPCPDDHRALTGLALHRAPFRYRGTGADLVHRFKFGRDLAVGHHLVRHMAAAIGGWTRSEGRRAVVVAVPRHRSKRRGMEFDQAGWLARALADRVGLALAPGVVERTRATLPQADPRVTNRADNVAGAFACRAPWAISGEMVLLVDDVFTSGATARACAEALHAGAPRRIAVVTAARA